MKSRDRIGEKWMNLNKSEMTIIKFSGKNRYDIQFNDFRNTILYNIRYDHIKSGNAKNPYHPSVYGVGYEGIGKYSPKKNKKAYKIWQGILQRCYDEKARYKFVSYLNCKISSEWECFQNFAEWYENNWKDYMNTKWHLDKDILKKGNQIYSANTCCFVHNDINILFTTRCKTKSDCPIGVSKEKRLFKAQIHYKGKKRTLGRYKTKIGAFYVYKTAKERYIKETADEWKPLIDPRVYTAMYNWKIEITD